VPDSNVRPAWRRAAVSARGARRSALARLLLYIEEHASKLDRKLLLLLFTASLSSACIIPLGPEFQDPSGAPNSPPRLVSVSPDQGTTVTKDPATFSVTLSDNNVGDPLFVRWIVEYPPFNDINTKSPQDDEIPPPQDGSLVRRPVSFEPNCFKLNVTTSTHQITAAVSDSRFIGGSQSTESDLLLTEDGLRPALVNWTLIKNCQGGTSP